MRPNDDDREITPNVLDIEDARQKIKSLANRRVLSTDERAGQAVFNAAASLWPYAVRDITGGRLDPFYAENSDACQKGLL